MKIGAVVQARTASTRLPGKVLKELPYGSGITVLEQVLHRLGRCNSISQVVVATTTDPADQPINDLAQQSGAVCYRGSSADVLRRYYEAAQHQELDVVVRITSDCPCLDPRVVDLVVGEHVRTAADFTSNCLTRTFIHGMDTEVLSFAALQCAHREATERFERQHVCPYIYTTNPDAFRITSVAAPAAWAGPDIRATLDTPRDYALLCAIYDALYHENPAFATREIIALVRAKPWLKSINGDVIHKRILPTRDDEMAEALRIMQLQDLHRARDFVAASWARAVQDGSAVSKRFAAVGV
jgi:spore coat polysaccharide biosynthesis protein SpsF